MHAKKRITEIKPASSNWSNEASFFIFTNKWDPFGLEKWAFYWAFSCQRPNCWIVVARKGEAEGIGCQCLLSKQFCSAYDGVGAKTRHIFLRSQDRAILLNYSLVALFSNRQWRSSLIASESNTLRNNRRENANIGLGRKFYSVLLFNKDLSYFWSDAFMYCIINYRSSWNFHGIIKCIRLTSF